MVSLKKGTDTSDDTILEQPRFGMTMVRPATPADKAETKNEPVRNEASNKKPQQAKSRQHPDWVEAGRPRKWSVRAILWRIWVLLRLYNVSWVPQPRPYGSYRARVVEFTRISVRLRHLAKAIVLVLTAKGGATKSTLASWGSVDDAEALNSPVLLVDLDGGGGKAAKRLGADPSKTMTTQRAMGMITAKESPWKPQYNDLVDVVYLHTSGVMVFHCPAGFKPGVNETFTTLRVLKTTCHTIWIDSGPGLNVDSTVGAVRASSIRVLGALYRSKDDLDDIENTLDDPRYRLREGDRINYTLIAISDVGWWHFNTRTQYELAKRFKVRPDQIVLIPTNRYLRRTREVDWPRLNTKAQFSYALLRKRRMELAVDFNQRRKRSALPHELDSLPDIEQQEQGLYSEDLNVTKPSSVTTTLSGATTQLKAQGTAHRLPRPVVQS